MKITIELTQAEAKGLKEYLSEIGEKGNKQDIQAHCQNIVSGVINSPQEASSRYIDSHLSGAGIR